MIKVIFVALATLSLAGCVSSGSGAADKTNLTHGAVKSQIVKGKTTQMEVIKLLGSPNITSKNRKGQEVWNYSKTASESKQAKQSGFAFLGVLGASGSKAIDTNSVSTFDLIITFTKNDIVEDYSIVTSKF